MSWTGNPNITGTNSGFAAAQLANAADADQQNQRAARVVAGWATDADDCAEMLAMLGLEIPFRRLPPR